MHVRAIKEYSRCLVWLLSDLLVVGLVGLNGCHSRSHSVTPPPQPSVPIISSWESPLHVSADVPLSVAQKRYSAVTDHSQFELHSSKPYQEVEIPLVIRDYHAYALAIWSGRQVECLVDTGAVSILWPQWLHLDSQQLDIGSERIGQDGSKVRGEWVLSPHITIGKLDLINVPTEAMGVPRPLTSASKGAHDGTGLPFALSQPILGMFAFRPGVLTIDYAHKRLVVRNKDYDVTRQPHAAHALLIPYQESRSGRVVLMGTLGGHKARYLIDTGEGWESVSAAFAHAYLASLPIQASNPRSSGAPSAPFVGSLAGDIGGLKFKKLDFYVAKQADEADIWLGAAFFRSYQVTIDPFRRVVLLENAR